MDNILYVEGPHYNPDARYDYKYAYVTIFNEVKAGFQISEEEIQRCPNPTAFINIFKMRIINSYLDCLQLTGNELEDLGMLHANCTEICYVVAPDIDNMPHYALLAGVMSFFGCCAKRIKDCLVRQR